MKNHLLVLGFFLSAGSYADAMESKIMLSKIKMPKKEELCLKLSNNGFKYFAEKTTFINELAGQELEPLDIAIDIEAGYLEFMEYCEKNIPQGTPVMEYTLGPNKATLYEIVFENMPEVLKELKKYKLYKPIKKQ